MCSEFPYVFIIQGVTMSKQHYFEPEFKKQIVQLYLQGRTIKSLNDEKISLEEIKRLRKELEELKKENSS